MLSSYLPALVFLVLGTAVGVAFTMLNGLLGPRRPGKVKSEPYECGLPSDVRKSFRFGISFYMIAMLFILFDIEVVFLFPWAVVYRDLLAVDPNLIFGSMLSFLGILFVGYLYALKKGAFDWKS